MTILDEISELECLKRAKGRYFLTIPESQGPEKLSEIRIYCYQSLLETAGVAVFCAEEYRGKLMDILEMKTCRLDIQFQEEMDNKQECSIVELNLEIEIIELQNDKARVSGRILHEVSTILEADFSIWLLTPEELNERNGLLPD